MISILSRSVFFSIVILVATALSAGAQSLETKAKFALMVDFDTGQEMLSINPDARMYPASMTKMMTAFLVFERLKNGTLSLDDTFTVSEKAWRKGGSKMFVEVGKQVRVEDLLRGIIIQSGNDATIVVAEGLSGTEEAFAREMTAKAKELGMTGTQFRNASGWPDDEHYTTARDLVTLASAIISNFPEYYHFYSETEFTYSGITQRNRNPVLYQNVDADGLKTGHTEASGYGLTASAKRNDRRIVMVINGLTSVRERKQEAKHLLEWGFREWGSYRLFDPGETVANAKVWLGKKPTVPLIVSDRIQIALRRKVRDDLKVSARFNEPITAPVEKGAQVGFVTINAPDMDPIEAPLLAGEAIEKLGAFGRVKAALEFYIFGQSSSE